MKSIFHLPSAIVLVALFLIGATPAPSSDSYYAARRLVAATQSAYDADAQDYFDRAEALSAGCFDLTAISGTYTEDYVKGTINTFVVTCKADGTWSKLTEVYLLVGVQWGALTAKLKYDTTATLTNNGFVSGDYLAAGSGAGLTGDGSSSLDTGFFNDDIPSADISIWGYATAIFETSNASLISISGVSNYLNMGTIASTSSAFARLRSGASYNFSTSFANGFFGASRGNTLNFDVYHNGSYISTPAAAEGSIGHDEFVLFLRGSGTYSKSTSPFLAIGLDFSDTDAANLTTATETLMDALGCGVIP